MTAPAPTRPLLLNIEGTTTSISFVYDQLFPYARRELERFVHSRWSDPGVRAAAALMAADGSPKLCIERARSWTPTSRTAGSRPSRGMIWDAGYTSGELRGHLYPDVPLALERAAELGLPVAIYSSGSVHAQRLLFGHSDAGNLLPLIRAHFDTSTGPKKAAASYATIAPHFGLPAQACTFVTDHLDKARAAREASLEIFVSLRPGNAPLPADHGFSTVGSLLDLPVLSP